MHTAGRSTSTGRLAVPLRYILLTVGLLAFYITLRLLNVMDLPLFLDEAIHIEWAKDLPIGKWDVKGFDGKWLSIKLISMLIQFPAHPLVVARVASIAAGAAVALLVIVLGRELYGWHEGLLAALVLAILPFSFFFNRLALTDTFQALFLVLLALLSVRYARTEKWLLVGLIGVAYALAVLTKFSAMPFVLLPFVIYALAHPIRDYPAGQLKLAVVLIPLFALLYLHFAGNTSVDAQMAEKIGIPSSIELVLQIWHNAGRMLRWYWQLLTPPIALASLVFAIIAVLRRETEPLLLLSTVVINIAPYLVLSQVLYPRYLLPSTAAIALMVARGITMSAEYLAERWGSNSHRYLKHKSLLGAVLTGLILLWPAGKVAGLIRDPYAVSLPPLMRVQYLTGWPAGYRIEDLAAFLESKAERTPGGVNAVRVFALDHPYVGLEMYLESTRHLSLVNIDTLPAGVAELRELAASRRTYFVHNRRGRGAELASLRSQLSLSLVWRQVRPGGKTGLEVWRVTPQ